jgi:hypothetical protein
MVLGETDIVHDVIAIVPGVPIVKVDVDVEPLLKVIVVPDVAEVESTR